MRWNAEKVKNAFLSVWRKLAKEECVYKKKITSPGAINAKPVVTYEEYPIKFSDIDVDEKIFEKAEYGTKLKVSLKVFVPKSNFPEAVTEIKAGDKLRLGGKDFFITGSSEDSHVKGFEMIILDVSYVG